MPYKHPIPINVSEARHILGITTSRNLIEALCLLLLTYLIMKYVLFPFTFIVKAIYFVLSLCPIIVAFVGIGEKSLMEYFTDLILFKIKKGVFKYRLPVPIKIDQE